MLHLEECETAKKDKNGQWIFKNHRIGNQLYNTKPDGYLDVRTINDQPSLTQQQFKDECDINNIIKSYHETGTISHMNPSRGLYADLSQYPKDLREAHQMLQDAEDAFNKLPAKIRSEFQNDPLAFVEFCGDANNYERAVELGIAERKADKNVNDQTNTKQSAKKPQQKPTTDQTDEPQ